jgi:hypothetical protein
MKKIKVDEVVWLRACVVMGGCGVSVQGFVPPPSRVPYSGFRIRRPVSGYFSCFFLLI